MRRNPSAEREAKVLIWLGAGVKVLSMESNSPGPRRPKKRILSSNLGANKSQIFAS